MRKSWQVLFRMAVRLCDTLGQRPRELPDLERLTTRWDECRASLQRLPRVDPRMSRNPASRAKVANAYLQLESKSS